MTTHIPTLFACVWRGFRRTVGNSSHHPPYSFDVAPRTNICMCLEKIRCATSTVWTVRQSRKLYFIVYKLLQTSTILAKCMSQMGILCRWVNSVHRFDWCGVFLLILLLSCEINLLMIFSMVLIYLGQHKAFQPIFYMHFLFATSVIHVLPI